MVGAGAAGPHGTDAPCSALRAAMLRPCPRWAFALQALGYATGIWLPALWVLPEFAQLRAVCCSCKGRMLPVFFSPGSKIKKSEWGSVGGLPALPATSLTLLVLTVFCFSSSSQKWGQYNIWMQGGGKITWAAFSMPACRQLFSLLCNNFQHNCWFLQCLLTSLDCVVNSLHFIH